ncbi:hypothetical protein JTB14_022519 [Gonioctena quinquepunctata]|nr:hypothetical protein JTB14_022519 [Gonioctena quinquepunctata]
MSEKPEEWSRFAKVYNPIKIGSIDGTDVEPHDRAIERAINSNRLSYKTTKDTIKEVFSKYGKLRRFRLVRDIVTGMPKGYAFIEYESEQSAEDAYREANKLNIDGSIVFVDFECERLLKGWKPRRLGGGFGGKKESGQLRFGGRDRPFRKPVSLELKEEEERKERLKKRMEREERESRDKRYDRRRPRSPYSRS